MKKDGKDARAVMTLEETTMRKVAWRLVPFLCLLYTVAFIDRINVGFAALSMRSDLDLSASEFGFGAGLFFLGYFIFEIPSNLILYRVGARLWIARVMITWGLVSAGTGFIVGHNSFYALRFLLGVAEAGFFPGVILYLTYWFPKSYRGRVTAGFMIAIPISSFIAAQVSGLLLQVHALGLKSWQWMFLMEGIPSILLGFVVLRLLTDRPADASWLSDAERSWLVQAMDKDRVAAEATEGGQDHGLGDVLRSLIDWRVLRLALLYFGLTTGLYGIELWLPQIIKGFGLGNIEVGFVAAIPYAVAIASMLLWARYSDKTGNRSNHVAGACCIGSAGMAMAALSSAYPIGIVLFLSVAIAGVMAARPPFWSLPTEFLAGRKAAAAIAAINSIGNLGGFFGPTLIGYVRDQTGGFALGLVISAVTLFVMALLTPSLGRSAKARAQPQAAPHFHSSGGPIA
jgi:ACS family tartrate transporter-like MFS transporter